jgi:hypothetical protein
MLGSLWSCNRCKRWPRQQNCQNGVRTHRQPKHVAREPSTNNSQFYFGLAPPP